MRELAEEPDPSMESDAAAYERKYLRGRYHQSETIGWEVELREYFLRMHSLFITVRIAPTNEDATSEARLHHIALWTSEFVGEALCHNGGRRVMIAPGKHTFAVAQHFSTYAHNVRVDWEPAAGAFSRRHCFSAQRTCEKLATSGGIAGDWLSMPGFISTNVSLEGVGETRHAHSTQFRRLLHVGRAADTAILGTGPAGPGNPFYDDQKRHLEPIKLVQGVDYPCVGDFNGHYVGIDAKGTPVWFDSRRKQVDNRNPAAWEANYRALGVPPYVYSGIAERFRESRLGAGVVLMARDKVLAPAVYCGLALGLVNTVILDYDCAKELRRLLYDPTEIWRFRDRKQSW